MKYNKAETYILAYIFMWNLFLFPFWKTDIDIRDLDLHVWIIMYSDMLTECV